MSWILIAVVSGSLVVSGHDTKEACNGRVATLAEQKINARCVEAPAQYGWITTGSVTVCGAITGCPR